MKTFIKYLIESKDRFIKSNKNLTRDQQKELIKFFNTNRQAEKKVNWQKSKDMTYDDFLVIKMSFKSGRKSPGKMKCQNKSIKGLKNGKDYINVRMKTKEFCAYIPLSYDTAQKFNRDDYIGVCSGDWCIGSSTTKDYWSNYMLRHKQVPIYVVNNEKKWVVMIDDGNLGYEIWDLINDKPKSKIPNFDVKRELLSLKQKVLYNEVRDEVYANDEDSMKAVNDAKDKLVMDIKDNAEAVLENYRDFSTEWVVYVQDLIEYWEALELDMKNIYLEYQKRLDNVNHALGKTKGDFDMATFEDQLYTRIELFEYKVKLHKAVVLAQENYDEHDYEEAINAIRYIQNHGTPLDEDEYEDYMNVLEDYDLADFKLIVPEWKEIYNEDYHGIDVSGSRYEDYFSHIHNEWGSDVYSFVNAINEFIEYSYHDPSTAKMIARKGRISEDEIYQIFEAHDMY